MTCIKIFRGLRSFAGCTEDIKWGADLVFSVGEKMFAVTGNAAPAEGISFKVDDERFLERRSYELVFAKLTRKLQREIAEGCH